MTEHRYLSWPGRGSVDATNGLQRKIQCIEEWTIPISSASASCCCPNFPLYALVPAMEALRIANQNHGRKLYDWILIAENDASVRSGNGMSLSVDATIADVASLPNVLVFGGNHPIQHLSKRLLNWLRRLGAPWLCHGRHRHRDIRTRRSGPPR